MFDFGFISYDSVLNVEAFLESAIPFGVSLWDYNYIASDYWLLNFAL